MYNLILSLQIGFFSLFISLSHTLSLSLFADNFHLIMQFEQVRFADLIVWKII